jgi:hypothetical protein
MKYKIEKNIPIPSATTKPKSEMRLALDAMEIGDSIEFNNEDGIKAQGLATHIKLVDKKKFSVRSIVKDGRKVGTRIWRVS